MPEHTSFFSYLIALFPTLGTNVERLGHTALGEPVTIHSAEPLVASVFMVMLILALAWKAKSKVEDHESSVLPDVTLSLRGFFEIFIEIFYSMMKDMMGPQRAKRYFPLVGTAALFIFFSNFLGAIPGFLPPTSSWNITLGCALVVFIAFNYYGIRENGWGYFAHLAGPDPRFAPLIFPLEVVSLCLRPITLSIRLMLNMAVDHLLLSIALGMVTLFVPIPVMMLGTLVAVVQVVVFCVLTSIYITLATDHEEHAVPHKSSGQES